MEPFLASEIALVCHVNISTGCPKKIVFRKMAIPLIKWPFRGLKGRYGDSHKCRHIGDMHQTPAYGIDVLNTPKCQYFDGSNTFEQEFCYIPKDNFFWDTLYNTLH